MIVLAAYGRHAPRPLLEVLAEHVAEVEATREQTR